MNIDKNSVIDLEEQFNDFGDSISYYLYGVWMDARSFSFIPDVTKTPSLEDLQTIFHDKKIYLPHGGFFTIAEHPEEIHGLIKKVNFDEAITEIQRCLAYGWPREEVRDFETSKQNPSRADGPITVSQTEATLRLNAFLGLVNEVIGLPPTTVYEFHSSNEIFSWHHYWSFSYIMLNNTTGKGIVFSAGAYDVTA